MPCLWVLWVAAVVVLVPPPCDAEPTRKPITFFKEPRRCQNDDQMFDCLDNGRCVEQWQWCDGINDCYDYSDETACRECMRGSLRCNQSGECIPPGSKCNGVFECRDRSDETGCEYSLAAKQIIDTEFRRRTPVLIEIKNSGRRKDPNLPLLMFLIVVAVLHLLSEDPS